MSTALSSLSLILLLACDKGGEDTELSLSESALPADSSAATGLESGPSWESRPPHDSEGGGTPLDEEGRPGGQTFCVAGGMAQSDQILSVSCTVPMESALEAARNDRYLWQPGPMARISP